MCESDAIAPVEALCHTHGTERQNTAETKQCKETDAARQCKETQPASLQRDSTTTKDKGQRAGPQDRGNHNEGLPRKCQPPQRRRYDALALQKVIALPHRELLQKRAMLYTHLRSGMLRNLFVSLAHLDLASLAQQQCVACSNGSMPQEGLAERQQVAHGGVFAR